MYKSELTVDDVVDKLENILEKGNAAKVHFRNKDGDKKTIFIRN